MPLDYTLFSCVTNSVPSIPQQSAYKGPMSYLIKFEKYNFLTKISRKFLFFVTPCAYDFIMRITFKNIQSQKQNNFNWESCCRSTRSNSSGVNPFTVFKPKFKKMPCRKVFRTRHFHDFTLSSIIDFLEKFETFRKKSVRIKNLYTYILY